jgi:DNA-directed RNA polymerase specialized sigma24 family protein
VAVARVVATQREEASYLPDASGAQIGEVLPLQRNDSDFEVFVRTHERRIRLALCAAYGTDLGIEASAEAFALAWERWDKVGTIPNSAGYLYGIGRNVARRSLRRRTPPRLPAVPVTSTPWIEPGLPGALGRLSENQRVAVMLVHSLQWTLSEVAELQGVSKPTVQKHVERGLAKLRKGLKVKL